MGRAFCSKTDDPHMLPSQATLSCIQEHVKTADIGKLLMVIALYDIASISQRSNFATSQICTRNVPSIIDLNSIIVKLQCKLG
jgi:hypothetical protein